MHAAVDTLHVAVNTLHVAVKHSASVGRPLVCMSASISSVQGPGTADIACLSCCAGTTLNSVALFIDMNQQAMQPKAETKTFWCAPHPSSPTLLQPCSFSFLYASSRPLGQSIASNRPLEQPNASSAGAKAYSLQTPARSWHVLRCCRSGQLAEVLCICTLACCILLSAM